MNALQENFRHGLRSLAAHRELVGAVEELRRLLAFLLLRELGLDLGTVTAAVSTKIPRSIYLPSED